MKVLNCALLTVLMAVLPLAANAQHEPVTSVTVEARAMEGVWQITGAPNNIFCRVEHDDENLAGYCTQFGPEKGNVELEDGRLRMAFGSMALRLVIDGPMQSATRFTGRFTAKVFGIERGIRNGDALNGSKLTLSEAAPDAGGKAELLRRLLEQMRSGKLSETFVTTGEPTSPAMLSPTTLKTLGATESIIHIGSMFTGKAGSIRAQVYVVEFTNGERICSLNQRDDSAVDQFQCV